MRPKLRTIVSSSKNFFPDPPETFCQDFKRSLYLLNYELKAHTGRKHGQKTHTIIFSLLELCGRHFGH
jgi:hypothetical protein